MTLDKNILTKTSHFLIKKTIKSGQNQAKIRHFVFLRADRQKCAK